MNKMTPRRIVRGIARRLGLQRIWIPGVRPFPLRTIEREFISCHACGEMDYRPFIRDPDHQVVRFTGLDEGNEWSFARGNETQRVAIADVFFAANQVDVALDACRKGLGCGRFLGYQVRDLEAGGQLVRVLPDWEPPAIEVSLVYPHSRLLSPRIRAFVDWAVPRLRERLTG